ncbi:hypothetical protein [Flavobacterium sp.]|uniref:hypothetical protein n=1 Tax=Flavobacterium sp. TaxID=239 RepID=UPI00262F4F64|nr:hypothetical protein [Flavobacterium sp.]
MTQQILFIIVILIGAYYARKYGKKAQLDIEKHSQLKDISKTQDLHDYLKTNVFFDLKNMNDGFDAKSIFYFSESDFEIIIKRIEKIGLGIYGIEPWLNGEMFDVKNFEEYGRTSTDSKWYKKAFEEFKKENQNLLYSATYHFP